MSYIKIWIHFVFGTKNREPILRQEVRNKLFDHIKENAKQKNIFIETIDGYLDHIHCLISLGADQNIYKVVQLLKGESSFWMNKNKITQTKFEWADEYFAVSVSESKFGIVKTYINNQQEHHHIKSFADEYHEFINKYRFEKLG